MTDISLAFSFFPQKFKEIEPWTTVVSQKYIQERKYLKQICNCRAVELFVREKKFRLERTLH